MLIFSDINESLGVPIRDSFLGFTQPTLDDLTALSDGMYCDIVFKCLTLNLIDRKIAGFASSPRHYSV